MRYSRLFLAVSTLLSSSSLLAAGLEITQHGVKQMAQGYAGTATTVEDASVIATNPAGLLKIENQQLSGGLSLVHAQLDYDVKVVSDRVENIYGVPAREVNGPGKAQSNQISPVPHIYYSKKLNPDTAIGMGLYVPFASGSSFPKGWAGRYHSEETSQQAININPVIALRINEQWSIGGGLIAQLYKAYLTNQIDVGYLVAESILETVATDPSKGEQIAIDLAPTVLEKYGSNPNYQVHNEIDISSWAYGFNFGVLWEPTTNLTLGLNYRSQTSHIAKGEAKRDTLDQAGFKENLIAAVANDAGYTTEVATEKLAKAFDERGAMGGDLISQVYLPQTVAFSVDYQLVPRLNLMASVNWADWSVFKEMRLEYVDKVDRGGADITDTGDEVRRRDLVQPLHFEDAIRFGVAARYQVSNPLSVRAGLSLDQSPLTNAKYRTPRGPDSDRTIIGLGASYQVAKKWQVDLAYALIKFKEANVMASENPAGTQHRAEGTSKGLLTNFGAQVNYSF